MTSSEFLKKAEMQYEQHFDLSYEIPYSGHLFPMLAQYQKTENHYLMGIPGTASWQGKCSEKCFFDVCSVLDTQSAEQYIQLFHKIHDSAVSKDDPMHEFTFISFVICAEKTEKSALKKLQKLQDYRTYEHGWSGLRICIFDLSDEKYYYNSMGKAVRECMTRDHVPERRKKFLGII